MSEPKRGDYYLHLPDGSAWPDPEDPNEAQRRLRYQPDRGAELVAASYMQAYRAIIWLTRRQREAKIRQIRAAVEAKEKKP